MSQFPHSDQPPNQGCRSIRLPPASEEREQRIDRYRKCMEGYGTQFGNTDSLKYFSAPGRTEIGGNHTDHNHGKVLAMMSRIGKHAENLYWNKPSGMLDQMACSYGGMITIDFVLKHITASGNSSWKWLQNIYQESVSREQGIAITLAITERFIEQLGDGACRVHGGGFAGVILAVLPHAAVTEEAIKRFSNRR